MEKSFLQDFKHFHRSACENQVIDSPTLESYLLYLLNLQIFSVGSTETQESLLRRIHFSNLIVSSAHELILLCPCMRDDDLHATVEPVVVKQLRIALKCSESLVPSRLFQIFSFLKACQTGNSRQLVRLLLKLLLIGTSFRGKPTEFRVSANLPFSQHRFIKNIFGKNRLEKLRSNVLDKLFDDDSSSDSDDETGAGRITRRIRVSSIFSHGSEDIKGHKWGRRLHNHEARAAADDWFNDELSLWGDCVLIGSMTYANAIMGRFLIWMTERPDSGSLGDRQGRIAINQRDLSPFSGATTVPLFIEATISVIKWVTIELFQLCASARDSKKVCSYLSSRSKFVQAELSTGSTQEGSPTVAQLHDFAMRWGYSKAFVILFSKCQAHLLLELIEFTRLQFLDATAELSVGWIRKRDLSTEHHASCAKGLLMLEWVVSLVSHCTCVTLGDSTVVSVMATLVESATALDSFLSVRAARGRRGDHRGDHRGDPMQHSAHPASQLFAAISNSIGYLFCHRISTKEACARVAADPKWPQVRAELEALLDPPAPAPASALNPALKAYPAVSPVVFTNLGGASTEMDEGNTMSLFLSQMNPTLAMLFVCFLLPHTDLLYEPSIGPQLAKRVPPFKLCRRSHQRSPSVPLTTSRQQPAAGIVSARALSFSPTSPSAMCTSAHASALSTSSSSSVRSAVTTPSAALGGMFSTDGSEHVECEHLDLARTMGLFGPPSTLYSCAGVIEQWPAQGPSQKPSRKPSLCPLSSVTAVTDVDRADVCTRSARSNSRRWNTGRVNTSSEDSVAGIEAGAGAVERSSSSPGGLLVPNIHQLDKRLLNQLRNQVLQSMSDLRQSNTAQSLGDDSDDDDEASQTSDDDWGIDDEPVLESSWRRRKRRRRKLLPEAVIHSSDLLRCILSFMSFRRVCKLACVAKVFAQAARKDDLWRELYGRQFPSSLLFESQLVPKAPTDRTPATSLSASTLLHPETSLSASTFRAKATAEVAASAEFPPSSSSEIAPSRLVGGSGGGSVKIDCIACFAGQSEATGPEKMMQASAKPVRIRKATACSGDLSHRHDWLKLFQVPCAAESAFF